MDRVYFSYGDIIGNLLIILNHNGIRVNTLPYYFIDSFAEILLKEMEGHGFSPYVIMERNSIESFLYYNKEYFKDNTKNNSIDIIKDMDIEEMYSKFYGSISADVMIALNEKSLAIKTLQLYRNVLLKTNNEEIKKIDEKLKTLTRGKSE